MPVRTLKWWDDHFEKILMVAFYGYFCVIVLAEVVLRYVFNASTSWGEMTARYAFVYLTCIAAAEAARHNNHIRIDVVPRLLSAQSRLWLYVYFDLLQLALGGAIVWYSVQVMRDQVSNGQMMLSVEVNMAVAYFALPLGWGLFFYRVIRHLYSCIHEFRHDGDVTLGGTGE